MEKERSKKIEERRHLCLILSLSLSQAQSHIGSSFARNVTDYLLVFDSPLSGKRKETEIYIKEAREIERRKEKEHKEKRREDKEREKCDLILLS